ncbi:MAG: ATP-binding protein [Nanoarchaeota archaeon]|nr:ATP-binding protein [Nanoarchaeota archaeon]
MYIEREIKEKFDKIIKVYPVTAIVGARQAGKTTFLKEQAQKFKNNYLLFDDPDIRELFDEDIKKFEKQNIEGYEISVLDEVQYCKDAGKKLKYLADNNKKIWITSSSEILLSKEVLSYLVGRVSIIKLYPFSINEFLKLKNLKEFSQSTLKRAVWEHMTFGGYPKVTSVEEIELKKTILKDLYDTMVLKDIARTFSIADISSLELFTKYLSINIGNLVSYDSLSRDIKLSFQTLKKYIDAMEKSYLISRVQPFYKNKIKEIVKQPKIYFVDTGLRNLISKSFNQQPEGNLFENYVFTELLKMGFSPKYWRTKSKMEVDFVIEKDNNIFPVEVKVNAEQEKVERNMRAFIDEYKPKIAIIVSYEGKKAEVKIGDCNVFFTDVLGMKKILSNVD